MDGHLWGAHVLAVLAWYSCAREMYGDNCGIFAGKARPAPHLIQPCPEWCVHTSLLIQPQLHRAVNSLRFTAHLGRVLLVHMKPLSPARNIHRKISALMGKSIAYQSTIAIEVTECKCVNATLHRKRDFILLPSGLKSGKLLGCKLFTETVSSFVFNFFLLEPQKSHKFGKVFICERQTNAAQLLLFQISFFEFCARYFKSGFMFAAALQ